MNFERFKPRATIGSGALTMYLVPGETKDIYEKEVAVQLNGTDGVDSSALSKPELCQLAGPFQEEGHIDCRRPHVPPPRAQAF